MKKTVLKTAAACGLCLTLLATTTFASAAFGGGMNRRNDNRAAFGQQQMGGGQQGGMQSPMTPMGGQGGMQSPMTPMGGQGGMQAPTAPMGGQGGMQAPTAPTTEQGGTQQAPTAPTTEQGGMQAPTAPTTEQGGMQQAPTAPTTEQGGMQTAPTAPTTAVSSASSASAIVEGTTTNSAASLEADYANATTYDVSEGSVKITESGTYIVTGTSSDGNIVVKKGTTGVVLVLKDLDLTSTSGATLSINKGAEVKLIVSGSVTLTDAENAADEYSTDEDVADAYDGAAIKVKAGASAYITGTGTLTINGSAKNGIKVTGDADEGYGSLVLDGATVNITATNDGINANYDLAILSGKLTVSAGDDALHADRILTIGSAGSNPTVTISKSNEGIEATVVNLVSGNISVTSTDDGVNAANSDGAFASELAYSINVTGADVTVNCRADGLDSNGNINLVSGSATIRSASNGGDAGLDYDGSLYISDEFQLNNYSGVTSMGAMGGMMGGQMGSQMGGNMGSNMGGQMPGQMGGQMGGFGRMGR